MNNEETALSYDNARLRAELEQARADAAALRAALKNVLRDIRNLAQAMASDCGTAKEAVAITLHTVDYKSVLTSPNPGAALLAELAAVRKVIAEIYDVADAPGEDIRSTIDAYLEKDRTDAR